jgi:ATP-dependent protease ClpP protease subunit
MRIDIKGTIIPNDYAWIYDWLEWDYAAPKNVQEIIDKAKGEPLDVYIDSGGGDIFAGSAIYSALRAYKGVVKIHVIGLAASAASVIACAAESDIAPTAMVMVHNVSTDTHGDYHDMDKSSETLKKANKAIAAAYVEKTGMTEAEALALMDEETWLSADEAVEKGLIDSVAENQNVRLVASTVKVISQSVIGKLKDLISEEKNSELMLAKAKFNYLNLKGE